MLFQFIANHFVSPFMSMPSSGPLSGSSVSVDKAKRREAALARIRKEQQSYLRKVEVSRQVAVLTEKIQSELESSSPRGELVANLRQERGKLMRSMYKVQS